MKALICLFVIAILLISAIPIFAQNQVGLVTGLNHISFSTKNLDDNEKISKRTVFGYGAVLDLPFYKSLILHMKPMYLQKGGIIEQEKLLTFSSSYIELPLFLKKEFNYKVKPYIMAGPTFALNLSSDLSIEISNIEYKGDMKEVTRKFEFGFGIGGGVSIPLQLGNSSIFFEGYYSQSLSQLIKKGSFSISNGPLKEVLYVEEEDENSKYKGFQFMMGITFPLKSR